jgi:hypothetical protein
MLDAGCWILDRMGGVGSRAAGVRYWDAKPPTLNFVFRGVLVVFEGNIHVAKILPRDFGK